MNEQIFAISDAVTHMKSKNYDEAMATLKQHLTSNPNDEVANGMLASVYAEIRLFDKAEVLYRKILDINPANTLARLQLGMIYFNNSDNAEALEIWQPALSDKQDFMVKYFSALALTRTKELTKAIDLLTQAKAIMPEEHALYEQLTQQLNEAMELN